MWLHLHRHTILPSCPNGGHRGLGALSHRQSSLSIVDFWQRYLMRSIKVDPWLAITLSCLNESVLLFKCLLALVGTSWLSGRDSENWGISQPTIVYPICRGQEGRMCSIRFRGHPQILLTHWELFLCLRSTNYNGWYLRVFRIFGPLSLREARVEHYRLLNYEFHVANSWRRC